MKNKNRIRNIKLGLIGTMGLFFAFVAYFSYVEGANNTFVQANWTGGADTGATAVHPTNQTGWDKYYSADATTYTNLSGKIFMSTETESVTETSDTHFGEGTRSELDISGTGDAASLVLQSDISDPFVSDLGHWTSLPEAPALQWWSAYVKAGDYVYALWDRNVFGRFHVTNEKWEFLANTPGPIGFGAALEYPGSGDFIYALRGGKTKNFWKYSISGDTWTALTDVTEYVGEGGSLASTEDDNIYCVVGNSTNKFYVYSILNDSWTAKANASTTVYRQGSLVYPGSGSYLYLARGYTSDDFYRYNTSNNTWYDPPDSGYHTADLCYPGTGDYLYGWDTDTAKYFIRFSLTSQTWENLGRVPIYAHRAILVYPGSGTKLKYLSAYNYSTFLNFDTSSLKWDEPAAIYGSSYIQHGCNFVWDGGDYIYKTIGRNEYGYFQRYSISGNTWENLANMPSDLRIYYGGDTTYLNGYVYATRGYNDTEFGRYNTSTDTWDPLLAHTPSGIHYGGALCNDGTYIYAFKGGNTASFYRYDPSANTWSDAAVADAPETVYYGGALCYPGTGDYIYASRGQHTTTFWKYDTQADEWTSCANAPFIFYHQGTLTYPGSGDYIYAFAGRYNFFGRYKFQGTGADTWEVLEGTPHWQDYYYVGVAAGDKVYSTYYQDDDDELDVYTISTGEWSDPCQNTYYSYPYYGSTVHPGGDTVYMFYGQYSSNIWKYSLSGKKWTGFVRAPFLFGFGTKACYPGSGDIIYVLQGRGSKKLWAYDYVNDTWTQKADALFMINDGSQLDGSGDLLFACGGISSTYTGTGMDGNLFAKYTISTDTWTQLTNMPDYVYTWYQRGNKLAYVPSAGTSGKVYWTSYEDSYLRIYDVAGEAWSNSSNRSPACYVRGGGSLYYPGSGDTIYCFTGGGYYKFFKYSVSGDSWTLLANAPFCRYSEMYDGDMFYPGSGDFLYLTDGYNRYFARYSISNNDWDMEVGFLHWAQDESYSVFCGGGDGDTLYSGGYDAFYKYNMSTRAWTTLTSPYNSAPAWRWDEWCPELVYPGSGDYLYATRGRNRGNFAKYSISGDSWTGLSSAGTYGSGHRLAATPEKIYCLMGNSLSTFREYDIDGDVWSSLAVFPGTVNFGSSLIYLGKGNLLYATRGNNTEEFYKYSISGNSWTALADVPMKLGTGYGGAHLAYPGTGDYIYLVAGSNYDTWGNNSSFFRYSISGNTWEDIESTPVSFRSQGGVVYPGKGAYLYGRRGYGYQYDPIFKFLALKEGTYTSEAKNIGVNKGYSTATWNNGTDGYIDIKARTANSLSMSGATAWDDVSLRNKGEDLSLSYPAVQDTQKYIQYQAKFYADDLTKLPQLNDLTINYERYPHSTELISSPYNTDKEQNRLMKLTWDETVLTATDVGFQLRTAPDDSGSPGTWSAWLGPSGTTIFNDDYLTESEYSYEDTIEVTDGLGRLKKVLQSFDYTQRIILDNSEGTRSYEDGVFTINIDSTNDAFWEHVKSDGGDIRFVDVEGNTVAYNSTANGASFDYANKSATIYVKIPSLSAGEKKSIYLKYGNADATTQSDETVVPIWEDFEGPTLDTTKFDTPGGASVIQSGGVATLKNDNWSWDAWLQTKETFARVEGKELRMKWKTSGGVHNMMGWRNSGIGGSYSQLVYSLHLSGGTGWYIYENGSQRTYLGSYPENIWYELRIVLKATGATYYYRTVGVETWTQLYDSNYSSETNLKLGVIQVNINESTQMDDWDLGEGGGGTQDVSSYFTLIEDKATSPSLSGWEYREELEFDHTAGSTLTDYQVKVELDQSHDGFWSRCRSDGYDVRFVDSDNTTILDYYRESFDYANETATFWVKMPLSAATIKRIYLYYGRSDAADGSSFDNTFVKDFGEKGYNISGVSLDGTGDEITAADSDSLDITGDLTLETNVKYIIDTWFPGFGYRKKVTIDNTGGSAQTNAKIAFSVDYVTAKMNADYSDVRFVDTDGTKLKYYLANYDATTATFAVKIPLIPADSTKDIYMYYGNANATSESDSSAGDYLEIVFDSDSDSNVDSDTFDHLYNYVQSSRYVRMMSNTGAWGSCYLGLKETYQRSDGLTFEWKAYHTTTSWAAQVMMGWSDSSGSFTFTSMPHAMMFYGGYIDIYEDGSRVIDNAGSYSTSTWYDCKIELKGTAGAKYYYKLESSSTWTLLYESDYSSESDLRPFVDKYGYHNSSSYDTYTKDWYVKNSELSVGFDIEETQPAIDDFVIGKSGAYEIRLTQSGLTGFINGTERVSTVSYNTEAFMHVAMTYDGSKVRLSVDGDEKDSADLTVAITANANDLKIGSDVKGAVDEVRVWNIARKAGSIDDDKQKYIEATETGLVCYLRLNDNLGTFAADATTNGNNGTLSGNAGWVATFPYSNSKPHLLYHMDDQNGGTSADSSGNNNTLVLNDVAWSGTELLGFSSGDSLTFNGATSYGYAEDSATLDVEGKISIEAWIKPDVNTGTHTILTKGDDSETRWNYSLVQKDNKISFSFYNGTEKTHTTAAGFITAATTYHIVATFDEDAGVVKIYADSVEKYSEDETSTMVTNDDYLYIGREASTVCAYKGVMDEVRIYKRILSAEEVKRHYEHRLLSENDPVIYNVYEPTPGDEIGVYVTNNPVIQPVEGVFYTASNIAEFTEISTIPWGTAIKYQISPNGYEWYWYNGSSWAQVTGGYSQTNTASAVNSNLSSFMNAYTNGNFYYRAYLHADVSALRRPSLDNIAITLLTGATYYDPVGSTPINEMHTDANNDRWCQYKAILYSDGENTAIVSQVNIAYSEAYITVLTPNGGENWVIGTDYDIIWDSQAITRTDGYVKLQYSVDEGSTYKGIATNVPNTGIYNWTVPDDPARKAFVKISSEDFLNISDISDAYFKILSLQVTSPNGGEVWEQGKTHNITWSATGDIPNNVVKIEYSSDNGSNWNTVSSIAPDTGTYSWQTPSALSDTVLVRVSSPSNAEILDQSNAVFSIIPSPAITFTAPAGAEQWSLGETKALAWQANSLLFASEVLLQYSTDGFQTDVNDIITMSIGTPEGENNNDNIIGSYDWLIPEAVSDTVTLKVKETSIPAGRDTQQMISATSQEFSIIEPSISITSPVLGNVWVAGDVNDITWEVIGVVSDDLLLEYSTDGETYTEIATGEANDETYSWTIPAGAIGTTVTVKVTDNTRTQVSGESTQFQVLAAATISVVQPNGGEDLTIGAGYDIQWTTIGQQFEVGGTDYNAINIYYSANNGTDWTLAAFQTQNTGSYTWQVADAESTQALIKIEDDNDTSINDVSEMVFNIIPPTITILGPDGGEVWYATGSYAITWSSIGSISDNLTFAYSDDGGTGWTDFATGEANDGAYQWTSISDVDSDQVLIRITDGTRPDVSDTSNAVFSITTPTITVNAPNGGEDLAVGTTYDVVWSSVGYDYGAIRDSLTIQYSSDGGSNWTDFATGEQNDSLYEWTIPDDVSDTCLVKIFDSTRTATSDTSDATFRIVLPYVNITTPNGGEQWPIGEGKEVTWTSVGAVSDNLKFEYSKDNFVSDINLMATGEADDGTYTWTVPDDNSSLVKVRITDNDRTEITDKSDSAFAIVNPIVSLTAPNGGELWSVGDTESITWENTGSVGNDLKLEYSKDNFNSDINTIIASTTNDNSHPWEIPDDLSATVRVRITDNTRPAVKDTSDANFTILPAPVITIGLPELNDVWRVGTEQDITWSDNGGLISNNLTLEYSTDSGSSWADIATEEANDGTYTWTIPDAVSDTCLVRITDATRPTTVATSPNFKISDPKITITSPALNDVWAVGDRAPVTWTNEGTVSDNLVLEYSPDGGTTYYLEKAGQENSGSYTWTVDDNAMSGNARLRITDGDRVSVVEISERFIINPMPEIDITSPDGGEEWVLLDTMDITWDWTGLSISDNLLIESSNDDFVTTRQVVATGVENTGTYSWLITEDSITGATLKIRITDGDRTEITDKTQGYFRIRGGFTLNAPNGGENWGAKSPQTITWDTRGNIPNVKLDYSVNGGTSWSTIAASTSNVGSYAWNLPDIQSDNVMVRVSDPTDPTVQDESDEVFNIVYMSVQFKLLDYDTLQHLSDVTVSEPSTGWSDTGLNSPIDRTDTYPYGTYTTFFTKTNFIDNSVTWSPPKSGTDLYVITVYIENAASAQVTWDAILTYSFSPASDTLTAVGSLQRKGKLVGTREVERLDMGAAILTIYEPDGETVKHELSATTPSTTGMYNFSLSNTEFQAGYVYPATLNIEYRSANYTSSANIDVGSEILQYEFFTETAANLAASVTAIEAAVAGGTQEMKTHMDEVKQVLRTDTASILASTQTAIPAAVEEAHKSVKTMMESEILNRQPIVRQGQSIKMRYRTFSGLSTVIVDVYNAKGKQKVTAETMEEVGSTGVYEAEITFNTGWGKGDFSIICSDSTYGSMDGMIISVLTSDIEQIATNISAVMGSTSSISDLDDMVSGLDSQFSIIEGALKNMSKDISTEVKDAVQTATQMEELYGQLTKISGSIKAMKTSTSDMDLSKFYEVEEKKTTDMKYLKNKTQELKAMMGLNQKMIDNVANEPVVQTWYEYRSVVLKAVIINPSPTQTKTVPFKIYLPKETKPEHIISRGELKVGYDTQQGSYYVHAQFTLKPKETKEVDIELKDIWQIKPFEIESLRRDAKKVYNILRDTEFNERAKFLLTSIEESLDAVIEKQKDKPVNPEDHISGYRENLEMIQECKADLSLLRSLLSQAKPINIKATWKLIVAIVIFLGLLSTGFYIMWQKQIKLSEVPSIDSGEKKPEEKK